MMTTVAPTAGRVSGSKMMIGDLRLAQNDGAPPTTLAAGSAPV